MAETATTLCLIFAALCSGLGHSDYRRRESAYAALHALTPLTLAHLHLSSANADAETASRAKCLARRWAHDNADWLALRTWPGGVDTVPWIWRDGYHGGGISRLLRSVPSHVDDGKHYARWRYAARLWVAEQYRAGRSWRWIVGELRRMDVAEREWMKNHR
jgi:hypothetical protein